MTLAITVATIFLVVAAAACVGRVLRPGSLADRIVALDTLLIIIVSAVVIHSGDDGLFLDVAIVAALLGFVGSMTVARFIEKRGA